MAPMAAAEADRDEAMRRRWMERVEIDTSAPFESVREAVDMFGGSGLWRTRPRDRHCAPDREPENHCCTEESDVLSVEAEAKQLKQELTVKEQETLDILKQLDATKKILTGLKLKLRSESAGSVALSDESSADMEIKVQPAIDEEAQIQHSDSSETPPTGLVLMELEQAKVNLCKATRGLTGLRCSVELLNGELEKEKSSLEKTRKNLALNSAEISFLEKELDRTKLVVLEVAGGSSDCCCQSRQSAVIELNELASEENQFKVVTGGSPSEIIEVNADNNKMEGEEESGAAESAPFSEINAAPQCSLRVTLPVEQYNSLTQKAQEADELSRKKIEEAMALVDEANNSKLELLQKVEQIKDEVRTSRTAMEEALKKVEAANQGKLAVEEALRQWRSDQGQKRRSSMRKSPKFKNYYSSNAPQHRRNSHMVDVNGRNLTSDCSDDDNNNTELKSALSIGEILSRKLKGFEELEKRGQENRYGEPEVSLAQMLGRKDGVLAPCGNVNNAIAQKQSQAKKKKFGFTINLAKHDVSRKKKKRSDS